MRRTIKAATAVAMVFLWSACQSNAERSSSAGEAGATEGGADAGEQAIELRYAGKAVFPEPEHDFGKVYPNQGQLKHAFVIRNEGKKSLRIQNVAGS